MMRVLFITHWYPDEKHPHKGVFIKEQAKALTKVGADIVLLHIHIHGGKGFLRTRVQQTSDEGINLVRIEISGKLWKLAYTVYPLQLRLIRKALVEVELDWSSFNLVHSNVIHPAGAIGHRLAKEHGLPHFISEHWSGLEYYFSKNLYRQWGRDAYEHAEKIFVVSDFLRHETARFVSDSTVLEVIPNVVSSEEFGYRPVGVGSSYYMVMVAKWNTSRRVIKRPKLVIRAVAEAAKELNRPVILGIVGDGDRIPTLKEFCRKHNVYAQFHGFLSKDKLAQEFQRADLCLHGSEYETFSVVIAESLKCGTPVVASNVGAIPELVNDENGLLVDNKLTAWKNAIIKAMSNHYDHRRIAEGFKSRFGYEEVGNKLLKAYRKCGI